MPGLTRSSTSRRQLPATRHCRHGNASFLPCLRATSNTSGSVGTLPPASAQSSPAFLDEYQILKYCTVHALEQRASFVRSRSPTNVNDIYDRLVGDRERNRPLRLYTHVTVGILETVSAVFPGLQFSKDSFFPSTIAYVYVSLVSTYIHPESHLAINVTRPHCRRYP
ncbi:hypothetical protein DL89DRAFT_87682 [Linderina pennispora]|uniref:Uncharacterized protein n=1 Tax=Linderina pennispora TaxID=61395 RepID=A0A1Y1WHL9_9FUNG|nr:uncharacterized protein DL89DRAFT_87682 [Linderina pennispora]ORX73070.1 hypothetical protein DL89DRAFT_87682 [Linderina pennispora]